MPSSPYIEFGGTKGINTVDDPIDLSPLDQDRGDTDFWATKAVNVDITDKKRWKSRGGRTVLVAGTTFRSINPAGDPCLFMDGSTLKQLRTDLATVVTIKAGLSPTAKMVYETIPGTGKTFCSDKTTIGYVEREAWSDLPDVTDGYTKQHIIDYLRATRKKTPAGHLMAWYNGRLYVAVGNVIWYTDPKAYHRVKAMDGFIQMDGLITLLKATADGLWVADGKTWFLQGPDAPKLQRIEKAPYNAKLGCACPVPADKVPLDGAANPLFKWASEQGICVGGPGGFFLNLTVKKYTMPAGATGTALYRSTPGMSQAIFTVRN